MSGSISDLKAKIRSEMREQLQALPSLKAQKSGARIQEKLAGWPPFEKAGSLGLYAAYRNEVETKLLFEAAQKAGKRVAYPRVGLEDQALEFCWVDSLQDLVATSWGPLAPAISLPKVSLSDLELLIVPGLAFDERGGRLGRGKGFYDRTLAQFSGIRLGLAYSFQVLPRLPREPWDETVGWVATEDKIFQVPS